MSYLKIIKFACWELVIKFPHVVPRSIPNSDKDYWQWMRTGYTKLLKLKFFLASTLKAEIILTSSSTNINAKSIKNWPCINNRSDCLLLLWTQFLLTGIDTSCNLYKQKTVMLNKNMWENIVGREEFQVQTWPSAIITNTWYWPPLFSTMSIATSTTGA